MAERYFRVIRIDERYCDDQQPQNGGGCVYLGSGVGSGTALSWIPKLSR
jgi:hypothetical protein